MSDWSPPSVPRAWLVGICLLYVLVLGYSVFVLRQILLGVLPGALLVSLYVGWRFLAAVEAIADALQRIAHDRETR